MECQENARYRGLAEPPPFGCLPRTRHPPRRAGGGVASLSLFRQDTERDDAGGGAGALARPDGHPSVDGYQRERTLEGRGVVAAQRPWKMRPHRTKDRGSHRDRPLPLPKLRRGAAAEIA